MNFSELGLNPALQRTVASMGLATPTPIQTQAIPAVLQGRDVWACAPTGSGKTLAYPLPLVQLVAAYAPHFAEECWELLGHTGSVFDAGWPTFDPALLVDDEVELVVQVNGKVRSKLRVAVDVTQEDAMAAAMADAGVARFVVGEIKKVIFVPKRLLNIVV